MHAIRHGKPTYHRGVLMRSRLETKWARFFDLLGWEYSYEPAIDLHGYIPDFVLHFYKPLLVEVKPAFTTSELQKYTAKIDASGWKGEALLVGASLFNTGSPHPLIGLLRVADENEWGHGCLFGCTECERVSVLSEHAGWRCRVCGAYDGNAYVGNAMVASLAAWEEATNRTQWRGGSNVARSEIH